MARNEAEEDFYRIFPLDIGQLSSSNSSTSTFSPQPDYIVLREAAQQISQGTTGLSCWQVCTVAVLYLRENAAVTQVQRDGTSGYQKYFFAKLFHPIKILSHAFSENISIS
jgi:hypothetical protein